MPFPLTAAVENWEEIDTPNAMAEHMMTGLRLVEEGVSRVDFARRFGQPIDAVYGAAIRRLEGYGMLWQDGDSIRLTPRARLLSNQVFVEFMP